MPLVRPAILLFAKAPVAGKVKTRLAASIGKAPAAELYKVLVEDLLDLLSRFQSRAEIEVHTDEPTQAWSAWTFMRRLQHPGDLGTKMLAGLEAALGAGHPQAIVLASDVPTLPAQHLSALLERPEDVVFGPSEDGGYYAIACRRTHPRMFDGVEWSTEKALEQSIAAALACELSVELGPCWFDVDEPEDLARLVRSGRASARIRRWRRQFAMMDRNPSSTID